MIDETIEKYKNRINKHEKEIIELRKKINYLTRTKKRILCGDQELL